MWKVVSKIRRRIQQYKMKRFLMKHCWFSEEELSKLTYNELLGLYSYWHFFYERKQRIENLPKETQEKAIMIIARNENQVFIYFRRLIANKEKVIQNTTQVA